MLSGLKDHEAKNRAGEGDLRGMTNTVERPTNAVLDSIKPVGQTTKVVGQTTKPVVHTNKKVGQRSQPVGHTTTTKPVGQTRQKKLLVGHLTGSPQPRATEASIAGPSSLCLPVDPQIAADAALARQLQSALIEDVPQFRELDNAGSSMEEDDDDVPEPKQQEEEKGKGEVKGKGKAKAKEEGQGKGKGKEGAPGKEQPQPSQKRRPPLQRTGSHHEKPCPECARWSEPCEKDLRGGACVGCKQRKVKCPYAPPKISRSGKKSKAVVHDSEDGGSSDAGIIIVSRPKSKPKRGAAKKAAKAITDQEMGAATEAGDKGGKPQRKRATRRVTVPKDTEELVDVIKSKCLFR